jgi:uncharacterized OB-fold protein
MELSAPYLFAYDYRRSVGPIVGRFLAGLRAMRIAGLRAPSGRVLVPPTEHDPETGEPLGAEDWVEVGPAGVVTTWAWEPRPRPGQPLDHPFAWALIRLDGADTALLHAVDAAEVRTGLRVRPRWRAERIGAITDIVCFEPAERP